MTRVTWNQSGTRLYETGVDRGVLYLPTAGVYDLGVAWNGLTTVTESPDGAEANPQYADNIKYLNLFSAEEFGGTIECFTYPEEFEQCDGTAVVDGVALGQQNRKSFGFAYRSLVGNDEEGTDYGYKLHLVYGAMATPSEKARATVNDSPEAVTFSYEFTTTAVPVSGTNPDTGKGYRPTAHLVIDSNDVTAAQLTALEDIIYGNETDEPRLPLPDEVISTIQGAAV